MPLAAPPQPRQSTAASRQALIAQRLAAQEPNVAQAYQESLENTTHYRSLEKETLSRHKHISNLWKEFVEQHAEAANMSAVIARGCKLPTEGQMKEFIRFMGMSIPGKLTEYMSKNTMSTYLHTFYCLWPRYGCQKLPQDARLQVTAYSKSPEFLNLAPLTSQMRVKAVADAVDIAIIVRACWEDRDLYSSLRIRIQFLITSLITALTSSRPGAVLESGCHTGSNECIHHGDIQYIIIPNPDDPAHPFLLLIVCLRYLKGKRRDDSANQYFFLCMEAPENRQCCSVMLLLYIAILDKVFVDVHTVDDILSPAIHPTGVHRLRIRPEMHNIPVLRKDVRTSSGWVTSPTEAFSYATYNTLLRDQSLRAGFPVAMISYDSRRGAAKNYSLLLAEAELKILMGHNPGSNQFYHSYQTRYSTVDLSAVHRGQEQDKQVTANMDVCMRLSSRRDVDAPVRLNMSERNDLFNEPVLIQMRADRRKVMTLINTLGTRLLALDENSDEVPPLKTEIEELSEKAKKTYLKYTNIVNRETALRVKASRADFFESASTRQLRGESSNTLIPMAATSVSRLARISNHPESSLTGTASSSSIGPNKENHASPTFVPNDTTTHDPYDDLLALFHNLTSESCSTHLGKCVDMLLSLPSMTLAECYPGQFPTAENKCPVCDKQCSTLHVKTASLNGGTAAHIHKCITAQKSQEAGQFLDDSYVPQRCLWRSCRRPSTIWASRADFIEHVNTHIDPMQYRQPGRAQRCRWNIDGDSDCEETTCDDWHIHFSEYHAINTSLVVVVKYCYLCNMWFIDIDGDGAAFREHSLAHFETLFLEFMTRPTTPVDLTPREIVIIDDHIEFEHGTGFGGAQPEFHGYVRRSRVITPMFCPWCVYDESLDMSERMKQWADTQLFYVHLCIHTDVISDTPSLCPAPSCGSHLFSAYELLYHLVTYHRLPVCRGTRQSIVRGLKLPENVSETSDTSISTTGTTFAEMSADTSNTSMETHATMESEVRRGKRRAVIVHDEDDDEDELVVVRNKTRKRARRAVILDEEDYEDEPLNAAGVVGNKKRRSDRVVVREGKIKAFCNGCCNVRADISSHLAAAKVRGDKCYLVSTYQIVTDGERSQEKIQWVPDENGSFVVSSKGGTHRCHKCRLVFHDIRDHLPDHCDQKVFRIKDPALGRKGREEFGPEHNFLEWLETAPPRKDEKDTMTELHQPKPYRCMGCSREFRDIRQHLDGPASSKSGCQNRKYRVRYGDNWGNTIKLPVSSSPVAGSSTSI